MTEYATAVALPTTSFEEFVANRGRALAGFALLVTGNRADAQDAVQEALIGAYPRWQRIAAQGDPSAYVRRSIINRHISLRRKLSRLVALGDTEQPAPDRTTELIGRDWALKLVLRVLEDQGFPEIAALMGVSEANARKLVSRGLAALRSELERGRQ